MILSFLAAASVLLVTPSWGALSRENFEDYLMPLCFRIDETNTPLINGQENPLSQTLENFIALAEKFEEANSHIDLKEELFYFIRNYTYDNIEFSLIGDVTRWNPKDSSFDIVDKLWEPEESLRTKTPDNKDPFTDGEKCSIFYMLSHSIILKPRNVNAQRSSTNRTRNSFGRDFNLDEQYPLEQGVVAIKGTEVAVALGKVLTGMYVGLNENRKKAINDIKIIKNIELPGEASVVDPLYTLTLAEVIVMSSWRPEAQNREQLAPDGEWVSAPIGNDLETKDICPMIYKLKEDTKAAYSLSSLRGAADGFILGRIIKSVERKNRNARLSQILRMYYSRGGLSERDEDLGQIWASFCNRQNIINPLEQTLKEQALLYELLVSTGNNINAEKNANYAWTQYTNQKNFAFGFANQVINDYCRKELTVDKPEYLPLESPLDVLAVLDTSQGDENIKKQQLIIGYLAKEMSLRYSGSRMTVLTDQKVTANANGNVVLTEVASDTHSAPCVACSVTQFVSDGTPSAPEDEVIIAIDQLLQAKKENETRYNGVKGKIVIYFNFQEDELPGKQSQLQRRVDTALRDLHLRHQDVAMYALGRAPELVKKYAKNDLTFVMSAVDEAEYIVGKKLFDKISSVPATLQYSNCVDGKNENGAIYEDFVSPNAIQHWGMPAKYFYKSRDLKFTFESQYGPIRVCHSRATFSPELQKNSCQDVTNGQKAEIKDSNPCKNANAVSCSPFYFSVIGVNTTATESARLEYCSDTNTENECRTLDQIKFKVTHEGIRCSGSVALVATPVFLMLAAILLSTFSKKF